MKRCHSSNIVEESERLNKNRNVGKLNTEEKTISQIDSKSDIKNTSCSDLEESEHVNKNRNDRKLKYSERKSSQSIIHLQDDFEIDISCPIDSKLAHNSTTTGDIVHTEDILSSNEDISEISSPNSSCVDRFENSKCIDLKIDLDSSVTVGRLNEKTVRGLIYTQISNQVAKMTHLKFAHNESESEMSFEIMGKIHKIGIGKIKADGSCFFRVYVHQIHGDKLNGPKQSQNADSLRHNVVTYIQSNYAKFEVDLNGRMFDEKKRIGNMENECRNFIQKTLPKSETWGGSESIKAILLMYEKNILIFNENGNCYYVNGFDETYKETILLAYRNTKAKVSDQKRDHYDSIISIDEPITLKMAKYLAEIYIKRNSQPTKCISINDSLEV